MQMMDRDAVRFLCGCIYEKRPKSLGYLLFGRCSCGGRTRTCDLQVMSLASYQLLHSAIFLICECKGSAFF